MKKQETQTPDQRDMFTGGRWITSEVDETGGNIVSSDGWHIAKINPYAPEQSHARANAALIAEAPAMYKALKDMEEDFAPEIKTIKAILNRIK